MVKLLNGQDHRVPDMEITVGVPGRVEAQTYCFVGERAEYAPAIFAGDDRLPPAPNGVALDRTEERIGCGLLDRDPELSCLAVILL